MYYKKTFYLGNLFILFMIFLLHKDWSGMDSLMAASRSSRLQTLQKLTELREFLEFTADDSMYLKFLSPFTLVKGVISNTQLMKVRTLQSFICL